MTESCEVWWADAASARSSLVDLLADDERARHARLRQAGDRDRYLVAHALLRLLLASQLGVDTARVGLTSGDGKPRLEGPNPALHFSLSHSGWCVVVAIAERTPVGVDVERVSAHRDLDARARHALTPVERAVLAGLDGQARRQAFYRYWVRKEAALKATGHGFRVPPQAITVSAPSQHPELVDWAAGVPRPPAIRLHDLSPHEGYAACLATLGRSAPAVSEHEGDVLLR